MCVCVGYILLEGVIIWKMINICFIFVIYVAYADQKSDKIDLQCLKIKRVAAD